MKETKYHLYVRGFYGWTLLLCFDTKKEAVDEFDRRVNNGVYRDDCKLTKVETTVIAEDVE